MKTYTLIESELQELLKQQRMICASKVKSDPKKFWLEIDINSILDAPSPLLPTEEVGIKEDDLQTGSCTIGNSIQQWETFCDSSYYDLWAVRPIGDRDFNSQKLFHVQSMEEAYALRDILNSK